MADLKTIFDQVGAFKLAPIDSWHPEKIVDIDIRISSKGDWYYQGSVIARHRIVKLFSTVLRLEGEDYFLVTPPAKYCIEVEDVPFTAVELHVKGKDKNQKLHFRTNMDEVVVADHEHPLTVTTNTQTEETIPYIVVRDGLKAKIVRSVYYQLAELLVDDNGDSGPDHKVGVYSCGQFIPFGVIE